MVRPLITPLVNALNDTTRRPALMLTVEDRVPHYIPYQSLGSTDSWNDVCIASDNSIIRVQLNVGGSGFVSNFLVQRITDPAQATQWTNWSTFPGSAALMYEAGGCAVTNAGGTLYAFAQRGTGGNNLWAWSSSNNGQTWSGPVTVLSPPGGALLDGIGSSGNNDVFFLYDVVGGVALGCSFFVAGSWTALQTSTLPLLQGGAGLAVAWNGTRYTIIYSNGYSLAWCLFDPVAGIWTVGGEIAPVTNTSIERLSPRLSFADGLYTLTCIEADAGLVTGAIYHYPRLRQSADLVHWSDGTIVPDLPSIFGVAAFKLLTPQSGSAGARYYLATLSTVYSSPVFQGSNPVQFANLSPAVLSYQRQERDGQPAHLEVVLDNSQGVYNALIATSTIPAPINLHASLVLYEGYDSAGTPLILKVGTYRLSILRFERSPSENRLHLLALDLSHQLDRITRYQNNYTGRTVGYLVTELCARAGLFAIVLPATAQVNQVIPVFTIQAGQTYRQALDELCTTYSLAYFLDQDEVLHFQELSASDPSIWTYQPEVLMVSFEKREQHANHIIVYGQPPVGGGVGRLTTAEVCDATDLHLAGQEKALHHIDLRLTSVAQCAQKATFLLAQQQRLCVNHTVTLPLNPALQLSDVLTLIDSSAPLGSGQLATSRITTLVASYDATKALAEMRLTLEGQ